MTVQSVARSPKLLNCHKRLLHCHKMGVGAWGRGRADNGIRILLTFLLPELDFVAGDMAGLFSRKIL